ncbi:hypothetical protein KCU83_g286, partial [Aureobasidium melanogenum]
MAGALRQLCLSEKRGQVSIITLRPWALDTINLPMQISMREILYEAPAQFTQSPTIKMSRCTALVRRAIICGSELTRAGFSGL